MREVLQSIKRVVKHSSHVSTDMSAIKDFVKTVDPREFDQTELKDGKTELQFSESEYISYIFVMGSLQFCFWGDPKWSIVIDGKGYDGSTALIKALRKAHHDGIPILRPDYLADLTHDELGSVLAGSPTIPLLDERVKMLRGLGEGVLTQFDGSFDNILKEAGNDAVEIVRILVNEFQEVFGDSDDYQGERVHFFKRAQIVPMYLASAFEHGITSQEISNTKGLTGLADYKAPQLLRHFEIIQYTPVLAEKIDSKIEITAGSEEEIEIRAFTIYANHLITKMLQEKFPEATRRRTHKILWFRSQKIDEEMKPYHRTRTTAY